VSITAVWSKEGEDEPQPHGLASSRLTRCDVQKRASQRRRCPHTNPLLNHTMRLRPDIKHLTNHTSQAPARYSSRGTIPHDYHSTHFNLPHPASPCRRSLGLQLHTSPSQAKEADVVKSSSRQNDKLNAQITRLRKLSWCCGRVVAGPGR
jgi:hypothetical protein